MAAKCVNFFQPEEGKRISAPGGNARGGAVCGRSLMEIGGDQLRQGIGRDDLVRPLGDDGDLRHLHDAHGEDAQKALGAHAPMILFDPDAALELVGLLDEKGGRSRVKTDLVVDDGSLDIHHDTSFR